MSRKKLTSRATALLWLLRTPGRLPDGQSHARKIPKATQNLNHSILGLWFLYKQSKNLQSHIYHPSSSVLELFGTVSSLTNTSPLLHNTPGSPILLLSPTSSTSNKAKSLLFSNRAVPSHQQCIRGNF